MRELFQQFADLNILIIGDVMMDTYLWGKVERISPEAPVPIVSVTKKENRLGGAANAALNIQALGASPIICAVIGDDIEGDTFLNLLQEQELEETGIIRVKGRPTTVKTRVIGQKQQVLRVDAETDKAVDERTTQLLLNKINRILSEHVIHAVIFEDYDKGAVTPELINAAVKLAQEKNIITVVDPKKRNFLNYQNVNLFKPNLKEIREGLKIDLDPRNYEELQQAASTLRKKLNAQKILITLSELGVYIQSDQVEKLIPAHIRSISDVSGAGDTVISTMTLCLAAGLDDFTSAVIANLAGGLVCEYVGVVPIDKELLLKECERLDVKIP